jgi:hypothetical protein
MGKSLEAGCRFNPGTSAGLSSYAILIGMGTREQVDRLHETKLG